MEEWPQCNVICMQQRTAQVSPHRERQSCHSLSCDVVPTTDKTFDQLVKVLTNTAIRSLEKYCDGSHSTEEQGRMKDYVAEWRKLAIFCIYGLQT